MESFTRDDARKIMHYYAPKLVGLNIPDSDFKIVRLQVMQMKNKEWGVFCIGLHDIDVAKHSVEAVVPVFGFQSPREVLDDLNQS